MYQPHKDLAVTEIVHPCLAKWRSRIDDAELRGSFDREDSEMANHWDMCAVGEASQNYCSLVGEVGENIPPKDTILYKLGMRFCNIVEEGEYNFELAREIITKIENRLAELQQESNNVPTR